MRSDQIALVTSELKFRSGPGTDYAPVGTLPQLAVGQVLAVLNVQDGWACLQDTSHGAIGYVSADYIEIQTVSAYFLPDLYWQDADGDPRWDLLFLDPRFAGAILKATQGTAPTPAEVDWFLYNWTRLRRVGGEELGSTWFRGCYHFLELNPPAGVPAASFGAAQAQCFVAAVQRAGGLASGDLPPIVDVENSAASGNELDADVVAEITSAWAAAVQESLGRKPMLYRRSQDSDWPGLTSPMGCAYLWAKRYNDALGALTNGWSSAALWQYTDGSSNLDDLPPTGSATKYPASAPGIGANDMSIVQCGDGSLASIRQLIADSITGG